MVCLLSGFSTEIDPAIMAPHCICRNAIQCLSQTKIIKTKWLISHMHVYIKVPQKYICAYFLGYTVFLTDNVMVVSIKLASYGYRDDCLWEWANCNTGNLALSDLLSLTYSRIWVNLHWYAYPMELANHIIIWRAFTFLRHIFCQHTHLHVRVDQ